MELFYIDDDDALDGKEGGASLIAITTTKLAEIRSI